MFRGFKNSEYLEYIIKNDINVELESANKENKTSLAQIMASVFSATMGGTFLSLLNTYLPIKSWIWRFVVSFLISVIIVLVGYFVLYALISKIQKEIRERKVSRNNSLSNKKIIDKFNNVACDSVMVVENYLQNINSMTVEVQMYVIYECLYYLGKVSDIIRSLKTNGLVSVNPDITKIDDYRVFNLIAIVLYQIKTIKELENFKKIDNKVKESYDRIESDIEKLKDEITNQIKDQ